MSKHHMVLFIVYLVDMWENIYHSTHQASAGGDRSKLQENTNTYYLCSSFSYILFHFLFYLILGIYTEST